MRWFLSLLVFTNLLLAVESEFEVENTNIAFIDENKNSTDYNRLRLYSTFTDIDYENYLFSLIVDNTNNYNDDTKKNENDTKIYRAYLKYSDDTQIITLGKQRIPFGVGRVWNPIDIYNPIDATSIETSERKGTDSLRYEYALSDVSNFDTTISEEKYAVRLKGNINESDLGIVVLKDDDKNRTILGYEYSGELFSSGIELRSEGGYFDNENSKNYSELILGAEYSFENSITLLGEYKYNSLASQDYFGLNLSYIISTLWSCSYLGIQNLDDKSSISLARVDYSLSDDMELNFGAYIYQGDAQSEYGALDDSLFVRYFIHF